MSELIKDFSNVGLAEVRDSPEMIYELGGGVVPEIAEAFGHELAPVPTVKNLKELIGKVGPNKTLRDNQRGVELVLADAIPQSYAWVEQSGIMRPINRGVWRPDEPAPEDSVAILMGGVRGWIDRSTELLDDSDPGIAYLTAGNRRMDTGTEIRHRNIGIHRLETGRVPTEAEYMKRFSRPQVQAYGHLVINVERQSKSGAEIIKALFDEEPNLADRNLTAYRVAGSGLVFALQTRRAARQLNPNFDSEDNPQMFAVTDEIKLAANRDQVANPAEYQSPISVLRQVIVSAKELIDQ